MRNTVSARQPQTCVSRRFRRMRTAHHFEQHIQMSLMHVTILVAKPRGCFPGLLMRRGHTHSPQDRQSSVPPAQSPHSVSHKSIHLSSTQHLQCMDDEAQVGKPGKEVVAGVWLSGRVPRAPKFPALGTKRRSPVRLMQITPPRLLRLILQSCEGPLATERCHDDLQNESDAAGSKGFRKASSKAQDKCRMCAGKTSAKHHSFVRRRELTSRDHARLSPICW